MKVEPKEYLHPSVVADGKSHLLWEAGVQRRGFRWPPYPVLVNHGAMACLWLASPGYSAWRERTLSTCPHRAIRKSESEHQDALSASEC